VPPQPVHPACISPAHLPLARISPLTRRRLSRLASSRPPPPLPPRQALLLPKPLRFGAGEVAPGPEAGTLLAKVARTLEQNPAFDLLIEGHADPSERDAPKLCAARAAAVKKALLAHGVRCGLLTASMGADCPVAPNSTAQGRKHNRRVELQLRTK
jgi:outer membrane protein OmpA-like peptidoglycan-associated protein